jgi:putative spermidine/putrescine transport system substrate-binding protein
MGPDVSRRDFIASMAAAGAASGAFVGLDGGQAWAAESLVGVTWGGAQLEASKALAEKFGSQVKPTTFSWELHQGGAANILPKIRATWPQVKYDIVAAWDPVWHGMIQEDWLEPLGDLPNLKDVPERFWTKDRQGRPVTAPLNLAALMWGYRTDLVKKPIASLKDLLDPSLKGLIMLNAPVSYSALQIVSMALEFGGNEKNLEPGFDFLKELARSGNVGRVGGGDIGHINSTTTGEIAVGFGASTNWQGIQKSAAVTLLNRVPASKGFRGFQYTEGWSVLRGPKAALAKEFANFCLSPANDEYYAGAIGAGPTNTKSKPIPELSRYFFKPDEIERFAYFPDFPLINSQMQEIVKRFETEIVPLIRKA